MIFTVKSAEKGVRPRVVAALPSIQSLPEKLVARELNEALRSDEPKRPRDARGRFVKTNPASVSSLTELSGLENGLLKAYHVGPVITLHSKKRHWWVEGQPYHPIHARFYAIWMAGSALGMLAVGLIVHYLGI